MLPANALMKKLLKENGIDATPMYIKDGSMKRTWRIYNQKTNWYNNPGLWAKLTAMGFVGYDDTLLDEYSGNGGSFCIFVKYKGNNENLLEPLVYNINNRI